MQREPDSESPQPLPSGADHRAFDLLDPGVQRQLYSMKWPSLRPIQVRAIKSYLTTDRDILLMAETAAGKTEAAFLPVLSSVAKEPLGSVRAVYVGPLKALINDQFSRVEVLCTHLEMPVHRWHGDVGDTRKAALLKRPSGILLITPESIESLLINRTSHLRELFGGLRAIVIDELHAFLAGERGLHLASLISRLSRYRDTKAPRLRLIGLSATIGDPRIAQQYLNPNKPEDVEIIRDEGRSSEILMRVHGYDGAKLRQVLAESKVGAESRTEADAAIEADPHSLVLAAIADDLVEHCRASSNLIFANRKSDIELLADMANEGCRNAGLPESFLVHHGSLSADTREDTEAEMKSSEPRTAICSSTLEMGIDIGSVRMVGQVGAPWSVASLKQRMGRSGRKVGEARRLRCYVDCTTSPQDGRPISFLPVGLLKTIAVCDLMLEGWVESPLAGELDLSTLSHQIISVIAEEGNVGAAEVYQRLCQQGPFKGVSPGLFVRLLRALGAADILEQGREGALMLGLVGEKLRARRDFCAAFAAPIEYSVIAGDRVLGTLPLETLPKPESHIVFAARRWRVESIDLDRHEVHVQAANRREAPKFVAANGRTHHRVADRMLAVLARNDDIVYLDSTSKDLLATARAHAAKYKLASRGFLEVSPATTLWLTWAGSDQTQAFAAFLEASGIRYEVESVAITCECGVAQLRELLRHALTKPPSLLELAKQVPNKQRRKYDEYIPDDLLDEVIASTLEWKSDLLPNMT